SDPGIVSLLRSPIQRFSLHDRSAPVEGAPHEPGRRPARAQPGQCINQAPSTHDPELPNEADFATSFARNSSVAGHLTQSQLRGANYTLGASLYLFSNSAIIDRCSSGEAFCIFAAAALWAASPFLICSMTCSRHFFPNSTNEFPVISTSHAPPSSLHVNFFILSSSFLVG